MQRAHGLQIRGLQIRADLFASSVLFLPAQPFDFEKEEALFGVQRRVWPSSM